MIVGQGKGITVSVVVLFGVMALALVAVLTVFGIREGREFQQAADGGSAGSKSEEAQHDVPAVQGDPAQWITSDDYPAESLRNDEEGTVRIGWTIAPAGNVLKCTVLSTSGYARLDQAACSAIEHRGHYSDIRPDEHLRQSSRRVVWRIPQ